MKIDKRLLKISRTIHVYLSIILLVVLVFFSVTGITLNHPSWGGERVDTSKTMALPSQFHSANIEQLANASDFHRFIRKNLNVDIRASEVEIDGEILIVDSQTPGSTILLEIDLSSASILSNKTSYGWVAYFNDLHKGRHTQVLWKGFIDFSAILLIVFSLAGLMLLLPHTQRLKKAIVFTAVGVFVFAAGAFIF